MSAEIIRVKRAAEKRTKAQDELEGAIADAHPLHSLRELAAAAGLNHETVRKIVRANPNR